MTELETITDQAFVLDSKTRHKVKKTSGVFANHRIGWTTIYTPGTVETKYPLILSACWCNSEHVLIPGTLSAFCGNRDITAAVVATHVPGTSSIRLEIEAFDPKEITIFYETRLADAQMTSQSATDLMLSSTATLVDKDGQEIISEPSTAAFEVDGSHRVMSNKSGFQAGRNIYWTVYFKLQGRALIGESLVFTDTISAGLLFNGIVSVTDLSGEAVVCDLDISEEKDAYTMTIGAPFRTDGYRISFATEIAPHYFDESFRSTFSNTGVVSFDWQRYNLDGTLGQIVPTEQHPTAVVPFESRILAKNGSYDRATGEIIWRVIINPFNVHVASGMITEDLTFEANYPTTYVPGSFSTTSLKEAVALKEVSEDLKILFISIGEIGKATHTFTFKVKLDCPEEDAGISDDI